MKLHNIIKVHAHYTRSVNLERDINSDAAITNYIPTSRALRTLGRVVSTFHEKPAPRAWSLVGPYGSGKSSFALFLSQLLGDPANDQTTVARKILHKNDKQLGNKFKQKTIGYLRVLVTGAPEPLTARLLTAIHSSALEFFSRRKGSNPKVLEEIHDLTSKDKISISEFMKLLDKLSSTLERTGLSGIVIVIDELGKFLEYEARHYGANDIFLLQALAEYACKGSGLNLLLFVLLHQSFEQYAKGLGESLKTEWTKIQGRFEEIPFLESAEQVLRVVSAAFENNMSEKEKENLLSNLRITSAELAKQKILPGVLDERQASELFFSCYPLHPLTAMILPLLCQKIAQNERTLFSYLGSHEDFGVVSMLDSLENGQFIMPHDVFDYFVSNQTSFTGDYSIHRRWVEVLTAIDRLGDAGKDEVSLLKTIGLFNIMGGRANLKPSKEILELVFGNKTKLNKAIKQLQEKSVINYRRFSNEYRVWQGSDFDLQERLDEELGNLGNFGLAEELNKSDQLTPFVARKYSIECGALRYFQPIFVDAKSSLTTVMKSNEPRIIFFLVFGEDDKRVFDQLDQCISELDIVVLCATSEQLRDAVGETIALRKILANSQALNTDPVAKREFDDRLFTAELAEKSLIQNFLEEPGLHVWRHNANTLNIKNKRDLQSQLSDVLKAVYYKSPIIHNELINRDRPSTQANAARNKLLFAMQTSAHEPDLGIKKFPAEKAIYRAVLKETGIHQYPEEVLGACIFSAPGQNPSNIHFVWEEIKKFLESTEKEAKSFVDLNKVLMAPPYGVKAGLLPILYLAVYQVYQSELALYENRRYRPDFTQVMIERFTKRPDEFTVQRFRIDGLRASIFAQYSKVIHGDTNKRTLLELAKPLASFMGALPEYTQKTRRGISDRAQKVRTAFNLSKSPARLLFEDLPKALGFADLESSQSADLEDFSQMLIEVLRELRDAHGKLVDKQKGLLAQAFNREVDISLEELRKISQQWYGLEAYIIDTKGLSAFISRLTKVKVNNEAWFENVLMFLGHKPSNKWLDSDQDTAEYRLNDFARRIIDLEKIRLLEREKAGGLSGEIDFYLLRSVRKGGYFQDEVVAVDDTTAKRIRSVEEAIAEKLDELDNRELKLAALARIVDEFLNEYKKEKDRENTPKFRIVDGTRSND